MVKEGCMVKKFFKSPVKKNFGLKLFRKNGTDECLD